MNRRELLKLFGVGATVIPIVGGQAVGEAASKLVKPASVELIETAPVMGPPVGTTMGFPPVRMLLLDANNRVVSGGQIISTRFELSLGAAMMINVSAVFDTFAATQRGVPESTRQKFGVEAVPA